MAHRCSKQRHYICNVRKMNKNVALPLGRRGIPRRICSWSPGPGRRPDALCIGGKQVRNISVRKCEQASRPGSRSQERQGRSDKDTQSHAITTQKARTNL
jgi:hypothetical protein